MKAVNWLAGAGVAALIATAAQSLAQPDMAAEQLAVLENYADIAKAAYEDSLTTAMVLGDAIRALVAAPGGGTLEAARQAWIAARVPYMQTEAYRFGNVVVDEWEGRVNSWPLDEGLIDYVAADYGLENDLNQYYRLDVIANPTVTVGGRAIDASQLTPEFLSGTLQELGGVEANVATGYHAIEFLLWGQDLNGTGPGAGNRPYTDFDLANCTGGNCDRRAAYLTTAADLLIADLEEIVASWGPGGEARIAVTADPIEGMRSVFMGLGSMSFGELAGERMKLGLLVHDPEEEHDCFSDNTFNSHYYDALGLQNVYLGRYVRIDGSIVEGPSLAALGAANAPEANAAMIARLAASMTAVEAMKLRGETVEAYDQMIAEGNAAGNAIVQAAIDALVAQTTAIEGVVEALGIGPLAFERSVALDNPEAVFQ